MSDRILVVEDEQSIRTIVEYALRDAGFTVVGVGRGDEALDVMEREAIDLVVLDVMLPGLDGLEVCKRIRANPGSSCSLPARKRFSRASLWCGQQRRRWICSITSWPTTTRERCCLRSYPAPPSVACVCGCSWIPCI